MKAIRKQHIFIACFGLALLYIFISSGLHFHKDGKSHKDCLLCQYSTFMHSMETESVFAIICNFTTIFLLNPLHRQLSFSGEVQDFTIRPPPLAA